MFHERSLCEATRLVYFGVWRWSSPARKWFGSRKQDVTYLLMTFLVTVYPLQLISSNCVRLGTRKFFPVMKARVRRLWWKERNIESYKGPRDGKPSPGNTRGKVNFALRMPPEGEKGGIEMENSLTAINKGAEYVGKIKPYATTIRRRLVKLSWPRREERGL